MTRGARLRRTGILCWHCLRNLAFYESWYKAGQPFKTEQFWINANGNFLEIAVLEWCKLFGDAKGKHHFAKVIDDSLRFKQGLLTKLNMTEAQFDAYVDELRTYRDKFIAHLDDENAIVIPNMKAARRSTKFLYRRLLEQEAGNGTFDDAPNSARAEYDKFLKEGVRAYEK